VLAPGIYTGPGNRDLNPRGKAITIRSVAPEDPSVVDQTVVDCNGSELDPHRAFSFTSGEDVDTVINGLTITGGYAGDGGAVFIVWSQPDLRNCVFRGNRAGSGGAIDLYWSDPSIISCRFSDNRGGSGGALHCGIGCQPVLADCEFLDNSASLGGALSISWSNRPKFKRCHFKGNVADGEKEGEGGAVFSYGGLGTFEDCLFTGNRAPTGGVYYGENANPIFTGCTFRANIASGPDGQLGEGGVFKLYNNTFAELAHCLFVGNTARHGGVALVDDELGHFATLRASNCTFSGNRADLGSVLLNRADYGVLTGCIVYGNDPEPLWAPIIGDEPGTYAGMEIQYCCLQEMPVDANSVTCFTSDPEFAAPGACQTDETGSETWVMGDYHLKSEAGRWDPDSNTWVFDTVMSPCIDAGRPHADWGEEPEPNGGRINLGCYAGTEQASKSTVVSAAPGL